MNKIEQYYAIPALYIFTNKINGKKYVGETINLKKRMATYRCMDPKDDRPMLKALRKYGFDGFDLEYHYFPDANKEELLSFEEYAIIKLNSLVPNGYNICSVGQDLTGYSHTEEAKRKLSISGKNRRHSEESIRKMSQSQTGIKHTEETRRKMSKTHTGTTKSEATKRKISESNKKPKSEEHKRKLSEAAKARWNKKKNQ